MRPDGRLAALIAALAAVLAYASSLPGTFQYDDVPTIVQNEALRAVRFLPRYFADPTLFSGIPGNSMYRPVLLATYLANHLFAGYSPLAWHLTNVALHALCAALVALLAARLLPVLRPGKPVGPIPLLAGLCFALHPVHSEVVNYVSSRSETVATAAVLGALLLHLAARGRRGAASLALSAGALLLYAAGLLGKEIAVAFPPAVFLLEWLDPAAGSAGRRLRNALLRAAPAVLLTVGYLALRKALLGQAMAGVAGRIFEVSGRADLLSGGGRSVVENLLTQARVFWLYAGLLLVPVSLCVDRFVRVSTAIAEPAVLLSLLGIALLLAALVLVRRRAPLATFLGFLFLLGLAPTSTIIPLNVLMNEHRLYLPGVAFAVGQATVLAALLRVRPRAGIALSAAIGACWLAVVVPRNLVWQDPLRLWEENVRASPRSFRGWNQIGAEWHAKVAEVGLVPEAMPLLERALAGFREAERLYPGWYNAHLNIGIVLRDMARIDGSAEKFEEAIRHFERCRVISPREYRARYQAAATYGFWKRYDEAIARFAAMAAEDPGPGGRRLGIYLFPIARLSAERGDLPTAEATYREILDAAPDDADAVEGLATVLADAGRTEEAVAALKALVGRRPRDPAALIAGARFCLSLDPPDRRGAAAYFQRALVAGYRPAPGEMDKFLAPGP